MKSKTQTTVQGSKSVDSSLGIKKPISLQQNSPEPPKSLEPTDIQKRVKKRKTWSNIIDTVQVKPVNYIEPKTLWELINSVQNAEKHGLKVKAVAAGYSYSEATKTSGTLINMLSLNQPLKLPTDCFKEGVAADNLFNVETGIRLVDLNEELHKVGKAIPTMPGVHRQTLGGTFSTSSHGSHPKYGCLSDLIRSMLVVTTGGKVLRIEPKNGITDPKKYKNSKERYLYNIQLIQDDDWFNTVMVSIGCVGIIYSAIIDVVPTFYIREKKILTSWEEIKPKLRSGELYKDNNHLEILINPFEKKGRHLTVVMHHEIVDKSVATIKDRGWDLLTQVSNELPSALQWFVKFFPKKTPELIERALKKLELDNYVNVSYKVLHQDLENIKSKGIATEMAFPLDQYIDVVDEMIEVVNKLAEVGNQYMSSPISLRFGKKTNAFLGMSANWDVCMIDLPMLKDTHGRVEMFDIFQEMTFHRGGRPHWGKIMNRLSSIKMVRNMYPDFDKWYDVYKILNHKGIFNNEFTDRLGISVHEEGDK